MQNFKEYLKESEIPTTHPTFVISFELNYDIPAGKIYDLLAKNIAKSTHVPNSFQRVGGLDAFKVMISLLSDNQSDSNYLDQLANDVRRAIVYFNSDNNNSIVAFEKTLMYQGAIPRAPINKFNGDILIYCNPKTILTGIDKKILGCETLIFYDDNFLQPEAKVLNFLKINKQIPVAIWGQSSITRYPEWFGIVDKHLKGYRDINDCQEELIEAGLKEWAKL